MNKDNIAKLQQFSLWIVAMICDSSWTSHKLFCLGVIWLHIIWVKWGCAQLHHFLSHRKKFPPEKPSLNFKILIGCHCSCTNSRHRILWAKTSQEGMDLGHGANDIYNIVWIWYMNMIWIKWGQNRNQKSLDSSDPHYTALLSRCFTSQQSLIPAAKDTILRAKAS